MSLQRCPSPATTGTQSGTTISIQPMTTNSLSKANSFNTVPIEALFWGGRESKRGLLGGPGIEEGSSGEANKIPFPVPTTNFTPTERDGASAIAPR